MWGGRNSDSGRVAVNRTLVPICRGLQPRRTRDSLKSSQQRGDSPLSRTVSSTADIDLTTCLIGNNRCQGSGRYVRQCGRDLTRSWYRLDEVRTTLYPAAEPQRD